MSFQPVYIPVGVPTFHLESAQDAFERSVKLLRGVDGALDKEAMRVVSQSPRWEPGRQRDRAVNVTYTFPVIFQLR